MSHVLDIRRRTAQERLRNDHIDLLYQMESLSKENNQLLAYIQELEKQLELSTNSQQQKEAKLQTSEIKSQNIKETNDDFVKLQKDYNLLENELKTLKTTLSLNQKMRSQHTQELQLYEIELTQKDELINEIVMMSFEDCQGMRQRDSDNYQKIIQDQVDQIQVTPARLLMIHHLVSVLRN
jgi:predicted RNase H-like nuclease (RuvC/YqgF family)